MSGDNEDYYDDYVPSAPWEPAWYAIIDDDKDELMDVLDSCNPARFDFIQPGGPRHKLFRRLPREALAGACRWSAVRCAVALLEGPFADYVDINGFLDDDQLCLFRSLPLHYAADRLDYVIIDLLLRHGASADILDPPSYKFEGLLPLNVALGSMQYY